MLFLDRKTHFPWNKLLMGKTSDKFYFVVANTIQNKAVRGNEFQLGENCFRCPAIKSLDMLTSTLLFET